MVSASQLDPSSSPSSLQSQSSSSASQVTPSDLISQGSSLSTSSYLTATKQHKQQSSESNVIDKSAVEQLNSELSFGSASGVANLPDSGATSDTHHHLNSLSVLGNGLEQQQQQHHHMSALSMDPNANNANTGYQQQHSQNAFNVQRNGNLMSPNSNANIRQLAQLSGSMLSSGSSGGDHRNLMSAMSAMQHQQPTNSNHQQQQQQSEHLVASSQLLASPSSLLGSRQLRFVGPQQQQPADRPDSAGLSALGAFDAQIHQAPNKMSQQLPAQLGPTSGGPQDSQSQQQQQQQASQGKTTLFNRLWSIVGRNKSLLSSFAARQPQNTTL